MPKVNYVDWKPTGDTVAVILQANTILDEYAAQGYNLSLRQLYYQFVARSLLPNTQRSYSRLGSIISKARDAGLIDWDRIQDRGRAIYSIPNWESGEEFLQDQAPRFHLDLWEGQTRRCQVWVEKEALADVVARAANAWDVAYFPNKGYVSSSSIWEAAQGMLLAPCQEWVILHLGDHDPSGIDMSRDIEARLNIYATPHQWFHHRPRITVRRVALNMDQIDAYNPPPNPAKTTDARFASYDKLYGDESWELDALEPSVIVEIVEKHIKEVLGDMRMFNERKKEMHVIQHKLREVQFD